MQMPALSNCALRRTVWIAVLVLAAIGSSVVFACATPFSALAALAALYRNPRDALIVTGITWVANQTIGFGFLHYPDTWDTIAWGIAIGAAAMIATALAAGIGNALRPSGLVLTLLASFAAAFVACEIALYAATLLLPSDSSAFSLAVVLYILKINVVAFGGLLILQFAGVQIGLALPRPSRSVAPAVA
jgi:hypothetical protein